MGDLRRFDVAGAESPNLLRLVAVTALSVARRESDRGAGESEAEGNNQGPDVRMYRRGRGGLWLRGPWCADFISWCFEEAIDELTQSDMAARFGYDTLRLPFARSASAWTLTQRIAAVGRWVDVGRREPLLPGDVICWKRGVGPSWKGHVAIVENYAPERDDAWGYDGNRGKVPALVAPWLYPRGLWRRRLRGVARLW